MPATLRAFALLAALSCALLIASGCVSWEVNEWTETKDSDRTVTLDGVRAIDKRITRGKVQLRVELQHTARWTVTTIHHREVEYTTDSVTKKAFKHDNGFINLIALAFVPVDVALGILTGPFALIGGAMEEGPSDPVETPATESTWRATPEGVTLKLTYNGAFPDSASLSGTALVMEPWTAMRDSLARGIPDGVIVVHLKANPRIRTEVKLTTDEILDFLAPPSMGPNDMISAWTELLDTVPRSATRVRDAIDRRMAPHRRELERRAASRAAAAAEARREEAARAAAERKARLAREARERRAQEARDRVERIEQIQKTRHALPKGWPPSQPRKRMETWIEQATMYMAGTVPPGESRKDDRANALDCLAFAARYAVDFDDLDLLERIVEMQAKAARIK